MIPEQQSIFAAEILGWKEHPELRWPYSYPHVMGQPREELLIPAFHIDANASLQLVKWMAKQDWNCTAENGLDSTWEITFHKPDYEGSPKEHRGVMYGEERVIYYQPASTFPLAVLGAFLRANGKETE